MTEVCCATRSFPIRRVTVAAARGFRTLTLMTQSSPSSSTSISPISQGQSPSRCPLAPVILIYPQSRRFRCFYLVLCEERFLRSDSIPCATRILTLVSPYHSKQSSSGARKPCRSRTDLEIQVPVLEGRSPDMHWYCSSSFYTSSFSY